MKPFDVIRVTSAWTLGLILMKLKHGLNHVALQKQQNSLLQSLSQERMRNPDPKVIISWPCTDFLFEIIPCESTNMMEVQT